jgi:hypothetical protein
MKRKNYSSSLLLLLCIVLASCGAIRQTREDLYASRDKERKNFVQTKDGQVYEVNEVVFRNPLFGKSTVEISPGNRIDTKEVVAYQNSAAYYRRHGGQFLPRIKKGLINMYVGREYYQDYNAPRVGHNESGGWRTKTRTIYYLQKGDESGLVQNSPEVLKDFVKDYPPAMVHITDYEQARKKVRMWSWINTSAVIGGGVIAATGGVKDDKLTPAGYAGVGLFVGGFGSGIVNKFRRLKISRHLDLALEEYNRQSLKTKKK